MLRQLLFQLITYGLLCSTLFLSGYSAPAVTRDMKYWIAVCFNSFSQPDCFFFVCSGSGSLFKGFLILNLDRTMINVFIVTIQLKELITDFLPAFTPAIESHRFVPLTDFLPKPVERISRVVPIIWICGL